MVATYISSVVCNLNIAEISRGNVSIATNNTYTPVEEDRGGITLECRDTAHPNLNVKHNLVHKRQVHPLCKLINVTFKLSLKHILFITNYLYYYTMFVNCSHSFFTLFLMQLLVPLFQLTYYEYYGIHSYADDGCTDLSSAKSV